MRGEASFGPMPSHALIARTPPSIPPSRTGPAAAPPVSDPFPAGPRPLCAPGSAFAAALRLAEAAAPRDFAVCLRGESGTGKEVVARHLHARSARACGPFVAVNCGALPSGLVESELFGHRKGAFTGAAADHPGRFRQAQGGTLFLDEIGDMPLEAQVRLLRALQERRVCPVGDTREYPVDFRLVCATHRDLGRLAREGRFREDLLFRLDVVSIRLPPLRERREDIPILLRHFLDELLPAGEAEAAWSSVPAALWRLGLPGNVRELRNLAERYCVYRGMGAGWDAVLPENLTVGVGAVPEMLPEPGMGSQDPAEVRESPVLRGSRRSDGEILHALGVCGFHRGKASGLLGITRRALQYRLAKMGRPLPP